MSNSGISLIRVAAVTFAPPPASGNAFSVEHDQIRIETVSTKRSDETLSVVLAAEMDLKYRPKVTAANDVVVPSRERARLERALEDTANLISVFESSRRGLASVSPSVAFRARGSKAQAWLEPRRGIHNAGEIQSIPAFSAPVPITDPSVQVGVADRADGVALLGEVLAQSHALGRYRDLVRFFERAFGIPAAKLAGPLNAFLDARFGYTASEVGAWMKVRDPSIHADVRTAFALEPDAWPILGRMEQAARDVLLNKATWRDPSTTRRELWRPTSWTEGRTGKGVVIKGTKMRAETRLLDEFGVFPLVAQRLRKLPDGWWSPPAKRSTAETPFRVVADDQA